MRVLVVHQNFPGQFAHLVRTWSQRPGWDVRGLGRDTAPGLPGFNALTRYKPTRAIRADQHVYLRQMEAATLHGQATARAMLRMRHTGFVPDVIVAHPGWGETLYAKDVFPDARLVHLCEWFYSADGADLGFDPEFPISFDARARIRTWNALHTLNLTNCDVAVSPTHWQKSRHPAIFHPKIQVQHEGIATHELGPDPNATVTTPSGVVLRAGDTDRPVITYVARNLEPYRGFHIFMRALERIQQQDRRCHALIVGGDEVSYGQRPPSMGKAKSAHQGNWREHMLTQVKLDPTRTHFMGRVPREEYLRVLQVSSAHVYLTYPFVLSWSLLEAMACGAPIVASDTAPVKEVMQDGRNGRLVDFFDADGIAEAVIDTVDGGSGTLKWQLQAMTDVHRYGLDKGVGGYDDLLGLNHEPVNGLLLAANSRWAAGMAMRQDLRNVRSGSNRFDASTTQTPLDDVAPRPATMGTSRSDSLVNHGFGEDSVSRAAREISADRWNSSKDSWTGADERSLHAAMGDGPP